MLCVRQYLSPVTSECFDAAGFVLVKLFTWLSFGFMLMPKCRNPLSAQHCSCDLYTGSTHDPSAASASP